MRDLAREALERYIYPVDSQVYAPDGEFLAQVGANALMQRGPMTAGYREFLETALE